MRCKCSTGFWKPMASRRKSMPLRGTSPAGATSYRLSNHHWILANVGVDNIHDGTWVCRTKGKVSIGNALTIAYCSNWANIAIKDDEHVYGHTQCDGDDQSLSGYAMLMEWGYSPIKPICWISQSLLSAVTDNPTKERETTQNARSIEKYNNAASRSAHSRLALHLLMWMGLINTAKSIMKGLHLWILTRKE